MADTRTCPTCQAGIKDPAASSNQCIVEYTCGTVEDAAVGVLTDGHAPKIEGTWCYSNDRERYSGNFATREEAIAEASVRREPGDRFWIGQCKTPNHMAGCPDADDVIDKLICGLDDQVGGDVLDGWPYASPTVRQELTDDLHTLISHWIAKHHLQPTFWAVENIEEIEVPEPVDYTSSDPHVQQL